MLIILGGQFFFWENELEITIKSDDYSSINERIIFPSRFSQKQTSLFGVQSIDLNQIRLVSCNSIAVDMADNVYVVGTSCQSEESNTDCAVLKFDPNGELVYSVFVGGSEKDEGISIEIDLIGCVYVTGKTSSLDFPVVNALDDSFNGDYDCFAFKLSQSGDELDYSTYIGSSEFDCGKSISVDAVGCAYITGYTKSSTNESDFPTTDALNSNYLGGISDGFILKLSDSGENLEYSTYIGGSGLDLCNSIVVDTEGNAFVTGETFSNNLPIFDAFDSRLTGISDCFVLSLNATANGINYCTYAGGSNSESGNSITLDSMGNVYVAGVTFSPDFPIKNAYDSSFNTMGDCFVLGINDKADLVYSSYIGGSTTDSATSIAVDYFGYVYVTGYTESPDFPKIVACDNSLDGSFTSDCFVLKLDTSETALFSAYIGGSNTDYATSIAIGQSGKIYIAGVTESEDFTSAVLCGNTTEFSGGFLVEIEDTTDRDGDGLLTNFEEMIGTNPDNNDSDNDSMPDRWEIMHNLNALENDANEDLDYDDLTNLEEYHSGLDPNDMDTDDDNLTDGVEITTYYTDPMSSDSDSDGINDGLEIRVYLTNPNSNDTDFDGMIDQWEIKYGLNPLEDDSIGDPDLDALTNLGEYLNQSDPYNNDTDADRLVDGDEVHIYGTSPSNSDTDDDELQDEMELLVWKTDPLNNDTDSDMIQDGWEIKYGFNATLNDAMNDPDMDGLTNLDEYLNNTNPIDFDTDNDVLDDGSEIFVFKTSPISNDTDKDNLSDWEEIFFFHSNASDSDTDMDGMPDSWEVQYGLDLLSNNSENDVDGDLLTDLQEFLLGTDPRDSDSDDDGIPDEWEVSQGLNPVYIDSSEDLDLDSLSNIVEYQIGTSANNNDTDGDGIPDKWEWDNGYNPSDSSVSLIELLVYYQVMVFGLSGSVLCLGLLTFFIYYRRKRIEVI